jgi:hypothetical protein
VGCGDSKPDTGAKIDDVADAVRRPLDRFSDAVVAARPSDRRSIVELRATAGRTSDALVGAQRDLRDIAESADTSDRARVRDLEGALEDYQALADELQRIPLSVAAIEVAAERAHQAARDSGVALPAVDANALTAALRRARKRTGGGGVSKPVGGGTPEPTVAFRKYTGPAFQTQIPTGTGWAQPSQSEPTPGQLFRTSVRGPDGLFVIIDFTPLESASFGSSRYESKTEVGQLSFGSATRYVFSGGLISECKGTTCFDYIINSGGQSGGSGFAVLAGGGSREAASRIAQTVAESVTPTGQYGE